MRTTDNNNSKKNSKNSKPKLMDKVNNIEDERSKNIVNKVNNKKETAFFKLISTYYRIYIFRFLSLVLFTMAASVCAVIVPKLTQELIERSTNVNVVVSSIYQFSAVIISIFILRGIFTYINLIIGGRLGKNIEVDLRNKLLINLTKLDMSFYSDKKIGEILTKLISDTEIIGVQSQSIPQNILSAIFTSIGAIVVMFTINAKLAFVSIALCILMLLVLTIVFVFLKKSIFLSRNKVTTINGNVTDRINNINLIKASGSEKYEEERFVKLHKEYYKVSQKQINWQAVMVAFLVTFLSSINVLILIIGIILLKNNMLFWTNNSAHTHEEGMSDIIASMTGVNILVLPIMALSRTFSDWAQASTASVRVTNLIKEKTLIDQNLDRVEITRISGSIDFDNVTFAYPNTKYKIFENFSFVFEKGKSYAFVGETGVGKSTISKLLLRFYDPISGQILINNKESELKKINLPSYLKHIGYVEQEPSVLAGTFFENIKYGTFSASNEEVMEAAKKAEIHKYISSLENGYNTILGENGHTLSGGQKQRLVIARMFLKNPDILILDEATSSLDNIVEKEIQKNLDLLMVNRTTFVIAHRLSTIKNVDQIIVLEKDKGIVQIGTFKELINKPGHFQLLYNAGIIEKTK